MNSSTGIIMFSIILAVISLIIIIMVYKKRQTSKQTLASMEIDLKQQIKDMEDAANTLRQNNATAESLGGSGVVDVDLKVNERYLMDGVAPPDEVLKWARTLGIIGIAVVTQPDTLFKISGKGFSYMSSKLAATTIGKTMTRMLPKIAIKAGVTVGKSIAKLSNPLAWALTWLDLTSAAWDLSDVGKLSNIMLAQQWLEMRDSVMREYEKAVDGKYYVMGPLNKLSTDEFEETYSVMMFYQAMVLTDTLVNEKLGTGNVTDEQFWAEYENIMTTKEDMILNMTMKAMCEKYGGKYLGKNYCSYKNKQECDSSYDPSIKSDSNTTINQYVQWDKADGGRCVAMPNIREFCDAQGTANIGYDYDNKTCVIKQPYCTQFGYQFTEKDDKVNNFPNCYKTVGRETLDTIFGATLVKDIENLMSDEVNCGNRCTADQYCYNLSGKGGICLPKSKVGEECPAGMHESCEGGSECRLTSEGALASAGAVAGAVFTGGILTFPVLAASGGGRSIQANMGMCTAGADGINAPTSSNPGHYIPLGKKGCSAAWNCPTQVKGSDGKAVPYTCHNAFLECQPPRKKGETCDVVRKCGEGLWCGGVPITCREPGKEGDWCPLDSSACGTGLFCGADSRCRKPQADGTACVTNSACSSGTCLGGVCAKRIGVTDYLPKDSTCILANTRCEPGSFCNGINCVSLLDNGTTCVLDGSCKTGHCSRTEDLGVTIGTLGIAGVCANKPGSSSAGTGISLAEELYKANQASTAAQDALERSRGKTQPPTTTTPVSRGGPR